MNKVTLNIDKEYLCDVLVCGGGVSGFAAAVSAAKSGADVILIESGGFLGGTATKGLVGPFMTCYDSKGKNQIIKGLFSDLVEGLTAENGAISPDKCHGGDSYSAYRTAGHIGVTPFDVEALKRITEKMCLDAGVKLLYHTIMLDCITDNNKITRVYAADNNRIISISAKMFIDTTGSSALAFKAGAKTMRGNSDGIMQTASSFFIISGVDKKMLDEHMDKNSNMRKRYYMDEIDIGRENGTFPCGTKKLRIFEGMNGQWVVNMAQNDNQFDELDNEAITEIEISQRKQIVQIIDFLKKTVPALKNIKLVATASDLGIRESRRIVGHTILTHEHILSSHKFCDSVVVCSNSVDIHQKDGVSYTARSGGNYYIPLSCLISENIDNLLTAGKSLSADKYAFSAVRVMPPCIAMGEAVGICSAFAAQKNIKAADVAYEAVRSELINRGAYLE